MTRKRLNNLELDGSIKDLFDVVFEALTQNVTVTIKKVKYSFGYTFEEDVKKQQDKDRIKVTKIIVSRYINEQIAALAKRKRCTHYKECACYSSSNVLSIIISILRAAYPDKDKITHLSPSKELYQSYMMEGGCFSFNHMSQEEKDKIVKDMGKENNIIMSSPCLKAECAPQETQDDLDIAEWVKKVVKQYKGMNLRGE